MEGAIEPQTLQIVTGIKVLVAAGACFDFGGVLVKVWQEEATEHPSVVHLASVSEVDHTILTETITSENK